MMMDDLEKIMLSILEDHEDTFVLQNDLDQPDDVDMAELRAKSHLSDRRLGNACVLDLLAFFIWFEFLDGKLSYLAMTADSLVHSSIGTTTDESDDLVPVIDPYLTLISHLRSHAPIAGIFEGLLNTSF
jgi:hypothetical protein